MALVYKASLFFYLNPHCWNFFPIFCSQLFLPPFLVQLLCVYLLFLLCFVTPFAVWALGWILWLRRWCLCATFWELPQGLESIQWYAHLRGYQWGSHYQVKRKPCSSKHPYGLGVCHSLVALPTGRLGYEGYQAAGRSPDSESILMLCLCSVMLLKKAVASLFLLLVLYIIFQQHSSSVPWTCKHTGQALHYHQCPL